MELLSAWPLFYCSFWSAAVINLLLCEFQLLIPCFTPDQEKQPLSGTGGEWIQELGMQEHPPKLVALASRDSGRRKAIWNLAEHGAGSPQLGELKSCWERLWMEQTSSEAGQGLCWGRGSAETRPYV